MVQRPQDTQANARDTQETKTRPGLAWLLGLLAVVLTCLYPCVFMFSQNAEEARAIDIIPFFLLFLGTALLALLVSGLILRNISCAAVLTCLFMLLVINFTLVSRALYGAFSWFRGEILLVFAAVILLGLLVLFLRKKPNLTSLCGIIALTFGVLTLMSGINAVPKLLRAASYNPPPAGAPIGVTLNGEKRNVYYLVFDEYGGSDNLEFYFQYDNEPFWADLEDRGFSVSRTTRNSESCWTDTLVPNMMNLDYVANDDMPEKVRRAYLEQPLLTEMFRQNGYQINLINHRAFPRIQGVHELTKNQVEDNISEYLYDNSIYCKVPVIRDQIKFWMFQSYRDNYAGPLDNALSALRSCMDEIDGPTLTVSYIQCPHAPFLYDKDGDVRDLSQGMGWNWKDPSLYLGQLQYLNAVILETVDKIRTTDPEAVILLLSDHGARVSLHMVEQFGGPRFDAAAETDLMQNALCAVLVPGEVLEIEGDTAINATRKALDAAFGTDFGTIEPKTGYILPDYYNAKAS